LKGMSFVTDFVEKEFVVERVKGRKLTKRV
jgi:hypothetical protein